MTYKSTHTGSQIDTAVDTVLNENAKIKFGNITGAISKQANLKAALDAKLDKANVTSRGSETLPVYFDSNGKALPITSYEGTAAMAVADGEGIGLREGYALAADTAKMAGGELSDLSTKAYATTSRVKSNPIAIEDDRDYSRDGAIKTVFNKEAFSVIGSTSVSEEGIASGFSTSNYITTAGKSILYGEKEIVHSFKNILLNSAENRHILFTIYGTSSAGYISTTFYNLSSTNVFEGLYRGTNISGDNYILNQTISSIDYTQPIDIELKIQGVNISVKIYQNNTMAGVEKTATLPFEYIDGYVVFGTQKYSPSINYNQLNGQIDLSQFSITVDNKLVFSGAKTVYVPSAEEGFMTDKMGYEDLEEMKRSTFDRSKFEALKVGTGLSITNDGEVSNFSPSNYIRKDNFYTGNINSFKMSFKVKFNNKAPSASNSHVIFSNGLNTSWAPNGLNFEHSYYDRMTFKAVGTRTYASNTIIELNKYYLFELDYSNGFIELKINGKTDLKQELSTANWDTSYCTIGAGYKEAHSGAGYNVDGSIDLKETYIEINGEELISFNKTGIDQIKKDVYGLAKDSTHIPQISDSGILTLLTGGWLLAEAQQEINGNYSYISSITLKDVPTTALDIIQQLTFGAVQGLRIRVNPDLSVNGQWANRVKDTTSSDNIISWGGFGLTLALNTKYYFKAEKKGTTYTISYKTKSTDWTILKQGTYTSNLYVHTCKYGTNSMSDNNTWCEWDLNETKVIIDDQLFWQPTLRIPYTQSKTGNKIVDSVYRDRVQDMYEQFGYTHYYTLGDEKEKYNVSVVGSPTLVGGVASGFSSSNYLISSNTIDRSKSWEQYVPFKMTNNTVPYQIMWGEENGQTSKFCRTEIDVNNMRVVTYLLDTELNMIGILNSEINSIKLNKDYILKIEFTGAKYNSYLSSDNGNSFIACGSIVSSVPLPNHPIRIGKGNYQFYLQGQIDLSQFSITVDGKEVFRGYDPAIPNCYTLPQGENMDGHIQIIESTPTYEYDTNLDCKQYGSCAANTPVTLPKSFRDANYKVSVPYSAKTKTGFTPTVSGDYMAIGKVTLDEMQKQ